MRKRINKTVELLETRSLLSVSVADGGFESPALASPSFAYAPAGTPWTFNGYAGVISGSSTNVANGFANTTAPQGTQVGFLQSPSAAATAVPSIISQPISGLVSGMIYKLSFEEESRNYGGGAGAFEVLLGSKVVVPVRTASGNSAFDTVSVTFTAPASGTQTLEFLGTSPKLDTTAGGDASDKTTFIDNVQLTATTGVISGTVFNDINGNGKQDSGETGVAGITVFLDLNKDGKLDSGDITTVTNSSGAYSFLRLGAGTFPVVELPPNGERVSTTVMSPTIAGGSTPTVNLGLSKTALISGTVFNDANSNKVKDSGESGLSGAIVYIDTNNNGVLDFVDVKTTTNSSGYYSFAVPFGTYVIREVVPSQHTQTTPVVSLKLNAAETVTENIGDKA